MEDLCRRVKRRRGEKREEEIGRRGLGWGGAKSSGWSEVAAAQRRLAERETTERARTERKGTNSRRHGGFGSPWPGREAFREGCTPAVALVCGRDGGSGKGLRLAGLGMEKLRYF